MSDVLMALLEVAIPVLLSGLGGVCGWLWKSRRKKEAKDKAMEYAMRVLLYAELLALYQRHVDGHVPISLYAQEESGSIYLIYHDRLGTMGSGPNCIARSWLCRPMWIMGKVMRMRRRCPSCWPLWR